MLTEQWSIRKVMAAQSIWALLPPHCSSGATPQGFARSLEPSLTGCRRQEFLQQPIYHLRRVLLHPMGYIGQPLHGQIPHIALGPVETDRVQCHIPLAPNYQGW